MNQYPSPSADQHRAASPQEGVNCAVITVSDTRSLADDRSGNELVQLLTNAGHRVAAREIVPDEPAQVGTLVTQLAGQQVDALLITGGTGIAPRDQTPEAVESLFAKQLPGFGELFRMLSYQEIGPAAMLSRATAGIVNGAVVILMPGSTAAVRLAMEKLVLPELGHLVAQAASTARRK